jgi:hypothetical protein
MNGRLAFNLLVLAMAAYFVWSATGYEAQAARIPILIGGLVLVLQAWVTVRELVAAPRGTPEQAAEGAEAPPPADERRRVAAMGAWMLLFFALFAVLGTLPATFLFIFLFLAAAKDVRWWTAAAIAAVIAGAIRLLFVDLMRFELYPGTLFGGTLPPL